MSEETDEVPEDDGPEPEAGAPAWMATFGDLMSLLLVFFVLLLSFANMDKIKFAKLAASMGKAFGAQDRHPGYHEVASTSPVEMSTRESSNQLDLLDVPTRPAPQRPEERAVLKKLKQVISERNLEKVVEAEVGARGVTVRVKGELLYEPGSAQLRPESHVFLDEIARLTRSFPYSVTVEGHTDDRPIRSAAHPNNWHLSASRAIAALEYLVDVGGVDPARLGAAGYADQRPLVPNTDAESRGLNRRVEFVYHREEWKGARAESLSAEVGGRIADPGADPESPIDLPR